MCNRWRRPVRRRSGIGIATELHRWRSGGADGTRTHDPLLAKQVLFQLSYSPWQEAAPPDPGKRDGRVALTE